MARKKKATEKVKLFEVRNRGVEVNMTFGGCPRVWINDDDDVYAEGSCGDEVYVCGKSNLPDLVKALQALSDAAATK